MNVDAMHYSMYIQWSDEDQIYIVTVPELPGCKTHGKTYAKSLKQAKYAIESWTEASKAWGHPIPPPNTLIYTDEENARLAAFEASLAEEFSSYTDKELDEMNAQAMVKMRGWALLRNKLQQMGVSFVNVNKYHYSMLIQWSDEDHTYLVTLPEFSDQLTDGKTYKKAVKQGMDLLETFIDIYKEDGKPLPAPNIFSIGGDTKEMMHKTQENSDQITQKQASA
jgi:predicted RNase H-like HicB family nuclease